LSLGEAVEFIHFFVIWYRSNDPDHELWRQLNDQARNGLDRIHTNAVELIAEIRACVQLDNDYPLSCPLVAFAKTVRKIPGDNPNITEDLDLGPVTLESLIGVAIPSIAEDTLASLERLIELVASKRNRLAGKRGPKTKPREFVEAIIQTIEEYTGEKVERRGRDKGIAAGSPLDVVHKIVAIMDPDIKNGTIEEALKARSRARRRVSRHKRGEITPQKQ
jgi:hypothetical protein